VTDASTGLRVLDADAHVIEPGHVFGDWIEPGTFPADLPIDTPMVPCGSFELLTDQFQHGFDPPSYLRAMDAQGIDAAVVYPSIGLFVPYLPSLSADESAASCRSYNDWVAGWCGHDSSRLAAVGLVPLADVGLAVAEAERAATLGLLGVLARPNHLYGRNLGDPAYDPLWDALAGAGLVLAVHEGLGLRGPAGTTIGTDRFTGFAGRHALSHPMEQMAAMASLVLDGALERHPLLRVAFLESATGWLPYWLNRLDEHIEWLSPERPSASELFARQCAISSDPDDGCVASTVALVGADHVLWASDFPHPDAVFPGAPAQFAEHAGVDRDELAAMWWNTPSRFYRLESRFG
jgi:predicted TIM-barrel fold metal-dependent hydrolase